MTQVKICGLTTQEAVDAAVDAGADYLGFVMYPPSPRYIAPENVKKIIKNVPERVQTVAVCVNMDHKELADLFVEWNPDWVQCHGQESKASILQIQTKLALPVMKACPIAESDDVAHVKSYQDVADMLMLDAKAPKTLPNALPGGNGLSFDWELIRNHAFDIPWMLSGGLHHENVAEAVRITGAQAVDVSSGVESSPGVKDPEKVVQFIQTVKTIH